MNTKLREGTVSLHPSCKGKHPSLSDGILSHIEEGDREGGREQLSDARGGTLAARLVVHDATSEAADRADGGLRWQPSSCAAVQLSK